MHGFRIFSFPSLGIFSPFPHGTSSLSVSGEYLVLDDGPPRFPQDFKCPVVLRNVLAASANFVYRSVTFCALAFQLCSTISSGRLCCTPYNPRRAFQCTDFAAHSKARRVWTFPFSLALLGESQLVSLPTGTKIFQFPAFAFLTE